MPSLLGTRHDLFARTRPRPARRWQDLLGLPVPVQHLRRDNFGERTSAVNTVVIWTWGVDWLGSWVRGLGEASAPCSGRGGGGKSLTNSLLNLQTIGASFAMKKVEVAGRPCNLGIWVRAPPTPATPF